MAGSPDIRTAVPDAAPDTAAPPRRHGAPLLLAAAVVAAPLLLAVNSLFHPAVEMSAPSILAGARTDPGAWYVVHVVAATGALLGVAAAFGLRNLVHGRGRGLATTGLALTLLGAPILALAFAAEASVLSLAAELDAPVGAALAEAYTGTAEFYAVGLGVGLTTIGGLLLGLGLLTSGTVPRWQAATYVVATLATAVGAPGTPVGPIAFGVLAVVSVFFASRIAGGGTRASVNGTTPQQAKA